MKIYLHAALKHINSIPYRVKEEKNWYLWGFFIRSRAWTCCTFLLVRLEMLIKASNLLNHSLLLISSIIQAESVKNILVINQISFRISIYTHEHFSKRVKCLKINFYFSPDSISHSYAWQNFHFLWFYFNLICSSVIKFSTFVHAQLPMIHTKHVEKFVFK